jgi:hypothetical protein
MKLKDNAKEYITKYHYYEEKRDYLINKIEIREQQIERLKNRKEKLEYPHWVDLLLEPIAKELVKEFEGYYYVMMGTFGISNEAPIHFYPIGKSGKESIHDGTSKSITFIPLNLDNGEIGIRNYKKNTGEFNKGTIGEMNGMNHPTIKLSPDMEIKELIKFVR